MIRTLIEGLVRPCGVAICLGGTRGKGQASLLCCISSSLTIVETLLFRGDGISVLVALPLLAGNLMMAPADRVPLDPGRNRRKLSHVGHVLELNIEGLSTDKCSIVSSTAKQRSDMTLSTTLCMPSCAHWPDFYIRLMTTQFRGDEMKMSPVCAMSIEQHCHSRSQTDPTPSHEVMT